MAKRTYFTVQSGGPVDFPVDMLRFDNCFPADTESALQICGAGARATYKARQVNLATDAVVHPGRWASFGWHVVEMDGRKGPFEARRTTGKKRRTGRRR